MVFWLRLLWWLSFREAILVGQLGQWAHTAISLFTYLYRYIYIYIYIYSFFILSLSLYLSLPPSPFFPPSVRPCVHLSVCLTLSCPDIVLSWHCPVLTLSCPDIVLSLSCPVRLCLHRCTGQVHRMWNLTLHLLLKLQRLKQKKNIHQVCDVYWNTLNHVNLHQRDWMNVTPPPKLT